MFTRTTGCLIVPLWLAAMSWLVAHDMWPGLTAQDPPNLRVTEWLANEGTRAQHTIYSDDGRLGTIWNQYRLSEMSLEREDLIWIERFPVSVAPLRMNLESVFTADGVLDELTVRLENLDMAMRLHGERFHSAFSFVFTSGPVEKTFKISLADGGIISGGFNPFAQLTDLRVGQRWRMQVLNPLAVLTGFGDRFIPMLVEVTGEEKIITGKGEQTCLVVESPHARAWVDPNGAVQVQEMTLPVVGRLRIVREPDFDEQAHKEAKDRKWLNRQEWRRP